MDQNPPLKRRIAARIAGSRFFTFSLLFHVTLVIVLGSVVIRRQHAEDIPPPVATMLPPDVTEEPPAPPVKPDEPPEQITPATSIMPILPTAITQIIVETETPRLPIVPTSKPDPHPHLPSIETIGKGVPQLMQYRPGLPGGKPGLPPPKKTEDSVVRALHWLTAHQNVDGSWGESYQPGMTGLAALCFLGHGELDTSIDYGPTVKKAIDWLIAQGKEFQGHLNSAKDGFPDQPSVYQHAIGAYALGEYYSMTKDDRVKDILTQAIKYIVDGQNLDGGWAYNFNKGAPSDTSVTGWQVQALKAAHLTGLEIPGVDEALNKSMLYFEAAQTSEGTFGYHTKEEPRYSLAGVGTLCVCFWKDASDPVARDGIRYIVESTKKQHPFDYNGPSGDLYAWYYDSQACLMAGGPPWTHWNAWMQAELPANQSADGSWPPLKNNVSAGGDLQKKPDGDGPVYRTTLCALMLEVYYRYLPANR